MLFENMILSLQEMGFIDVVLPFLLIFTIVFAVMEKTKLLGEDKKVKKYSAIIAMVLAFSVVVPHVTGHYFYGFDAVVIINDALPQIGLLIVSLVMMLLTVGLWTGKRPKGNKGIGPWFMAASLLLIILIFMGSIGWSNMPSWLFKIFNSDLLAPIVAILVIGVVLSFIVSDDSDDKGDKGIKGISKLFSDFGGGDD